MVELSALRSVCPIGVNLRNEKTGLIYFYNRRLCSEKNEKKLISANSGENHTG